MNPLPASPALPAASALGLFLRANRRALAELLGASLLINAFVLTLPLFSMLVYDKAVGNEIHETLVALSLGIVLAMALELSLRVARVHMVEHAGARWDTRLDERLMRGVLAAPMSRSLRVGDVLARYRELAATRDVLSAQFMLPLADLPFVLLFTGVLWFVGGPLVLVPLVIGALLVGASLLLQMAARRRQQAASAAHSRKLSWLADVLLTRESLADPRAAGVAAAGLRTPSLEGARASSRARLWSQLAQQLVPLGLTATTVLTLVAGVFLVEARALSVGGLISSNMLAGRMVSVLCGIVPLLMRVHEFRRALQGLGEAVDMHSPAPDAAPAVLPAAAFGGEGLRLDKLGFAYEPAVPGGEKRRILDQLSLSFRAGELVALVGTSGAGKSTLLRLMAGHLGADSGRLVCAAHTVHDEASRRRLAGLVAYKPQEALFLGGTVAEVVAPGQPERDEAALVAALRAAGLGPALDKGELGLSSVVGTNGAGLSGGQRQMLALARVLASDRPVLLLDEPTLGLDRTAQDSVLRALAALRQQGRCIVVATHTTEVIQIADRVLVLDGGRIVADAPPQRLLGATPAAPASSPPPPAPAPAAPAMA